MKTIRAIRVFTRLFDVDTGKSYKLVTSYGLTKSGYFLLKENGDKWVALKEVPLLPYKDYNDLPYFIRLKFFSFLCVNYGNFKSIQRIIDSLHI